MLSTRLRIVLAIVLAAYFFVLLCLLKKKKLELKYTLLWLLTGVVLAALVAFPRVLDAFCKVVGIASPMNGLFTTFIGFSFCIILSLTSIVSKQKEKIRTLTQNEALLEERIRRLEKEKQDDA